MILFNTRKLLRQVSPKLWTRSQHRKPVTGHGVQAPTRLTISLRFKRLSRTNPQQTLALEADSAVMATICQAVPVSRLLSPSVIHHGRRHRGTSQLISQGVGSRIFRTSPQRDFETCCFSNDIRSHDMKKSSEIHIGNSEWWEKVNTAAVGVVLGVSIGASCFALPAFADFLSFDHADLRGRDMSGQDLKGVVFAACDCRKINLEGSNMDGSTDTFAGFEGGNLKNSSWVRAFADRVVFRGANLQNANFTDAILSGSQFDGADITGADFTDAFVDNYQRLQMCRRAKGTNPTTGVPTRESLFC